MEPEIITKPPRTFFLFKFAASTLSINSISQWLYILSYVFSQVQILAVFAKTALFSLPQKLGWITNSFKIICQVFSCGESWSIDNHPSFTVVVLAMIYFFFISQIASVIYLLCGDWINTKPCAFVIRYWAIQTCLLLRVLFYPIHFIGVSVLSEIAKSNPDTRIYSQLTYLIFQISIIAGLVWNFFHAAGTLLFLTPRVKTKNPLSVHTNFIECTDLIIKTIFPILWSFGSKTIQGSVFLPALCFAVSIYRDWTLYWFLPYYNISMLKLATKIHAFLTIFAFSIMFPKSIAESLGDGDSDFLFSFIIVILVGPMVIVVYAKQVHKVIIDILLNPSKMKPYYLLHYWEVWKYIFARSKVPTSRALKTNTNYLYLSIIIQSLQIQGIMFDGENILEDKSATLISQHIFTKYLDLLRNSIKKNSKREILRVCLARQYAKSERIYLLADELVREGLTSGFFIQSSFYFIKVKMLNKVNSSRQSLLIGEYNSNLSDGSDIQKYIELNHIYEDLKREIGEELRLQLRFWENYQAQEPDCKIILHTSQDIRRRAKKIKQQWVNLNKQMGPEFTQPRLIYGFYLSFIRNELASGDHLLREYERLQARNEELSDEIQAKMSIQSLFNSICLTISGSSTSFGKILDCSSNIKKYLGFTRGFVLGQNVTLIIPALSEHFRKNQNFSKMEINMLNTKREIYALDKEGYLEPCWFYMTLRLLSNYELCYSLILNPQMSSDRVVLVQENGKIVNCSMNFADDLGFTSKIKPNLNIFQMCPELREFPTNNVPNSSNRTLTNFTDHPQPSDSAIIEDEFKAFSNKFELLGKRYKRFTGKIKLEENSFTFCYPPKGRSSRAPTFINSYPTVVIYNVRLQDALDGEDGLLHLKLKKVSLPDHLDISNNQDSCECIDNVSLNQKKLSSESLKPVMSKEVISIPIPKKPENNMFPLVNKHLPSSVNRKEKILITVTSTNPDNEDLKPLNMATLETNRESSMINLKTRRSDLNNIETVRTNQGDLDNLSEEDLELENLRKFKQSRRKPRKQKEQEKSYVPIEEALRELIRDSENPFEQCREGKSYQEIQKILKEKKYKRPVITYIILFLFTMLVQLAFLLWLNFKVFRASYESENLSKALEATYLRAHWVNLANQELRFWVAMRGNIFHGWDIFEETPIMNITFIRFNDQHKELIRSIRCLRPELQSLFFEKNVRVYERDGNNKLKLFDIEDTFQIIEKIIVRGLKTSYRIPEDLTPLVDFIDEESRFIFDNSFDDLLIVSERIIDILASEIFSLLSQVRTDIVIFLSVCILHVGVLVVYSVRFVTKMNEETEDFMRLFLSLPTIEAKRIEKTVSKFYSIIKAEPTKKDVTDQNETIRFYINIKRNNMSNDSFGNVNRVPRKSPLRRSLWFLKSKNWISIFETFVALLIIIGLVIIYYIKALDQINLIEKYQNNINSSLENIKLASLISVQIHAMILDNNTATFRHRPVLETLLPDIDKMKRITEVYLQLTDENGDLSPRQHEIFYNMSCDEAYTPDYILSEEFAVTTCHSLSKGSGSLGLFNILSDFSINIPEYVDKFQNSERTMKDIGRLYDEFPKVFGDLYDVSMPYFFKSVQATIDEFQGLKDKLESQRALLGWISVVILLILVAILWLFIIKKLVQRVFEPQDVMRLIPPRLIYKNSFLKKYVYDIRK